MDSRDHALPLLSNPKSNSRIGNLFKHNGVRNHDLMPVLRKLAEKMITATQKQTKRKEARDRNPPNSAALAPRMSATSPHENPNTMATRAHKHQSTLGFNSHHRPRPPRNLAAKTSPPSECEFTKSPQHQRATACHRSAHTAAATHMCE